MMWNRIVLMVVTVMATWTIWIGSSLFLVTYAVPRPLPLGIALLVTALWSTLSLCLIPITTIAAAVVDEWVYGKQPVDMDKSITDIFIEE